MQIYVTKYCLYVQKELYIILHLYLIDYTELTINFLI